MAKGKSPNRKHRDLINSRYRELKAIRVSKGLEEAGRYKPRGCYLCSGCKNALVEPNDNQTGQHVLLCPKCAEKDPALQRGREFLEKH